MTEQPPPHTEWMKSSSMILPSGDDFKVRKIPERPHEAWLWVFGMIGSWLALSALILAGDSHHIVQAGVNSVLGLCCATIWGVLFMARR